MNPSLKVFAPADPGPSIGVEKIQTYVRIPEQARLDERLSSRDRDVFAAVIAAMRAEGSQGRTYVKNSDLETKYGRFGPTAVKKALANLKAAGYLVIERDRDRPFAPRVISLSFDFATRSPSVGLSIAKLPFAPENTPTTQLPLLPELAKALGERMDPVRAQKRPRQGAKAPSHPY